MDFFELDGHTYYLIKDKLFFVKNPEPKKWLEDFFKLKEKEFRIQTTRSYRKQSIYGGDI